MVSAFVIQIPPIWVVFHTIAGQKIPIRSRRPQGTGEFQESRVERIEHERLVSFHFRETHPVLVVDVRNHLDEQRHCDSQMLNDVLHIFFQHHDSKPDMQNFLVFAILMNRKINSVLFIQLPYFIDECSNFNFYSKTETMR